MAPRGQGITYYYVMSCVILLRKQDIVTINNWKREAHLHVFPFHPNQTRVATFWCDDPDEVKHRLIIIEQSA